MVVDARLSTQGVLLRVLASGQLLSAQTPLDLQPGTRLRVEVATSAGADAPIRLRIVADPDAASVEAAVRQAAVRRFLPRQEPLPVLLRLLQASPSGVSEPVQRAIEGLQVSLPTRAALTTADGLQQALQNSGVFLEARLAEAAATLDVRQDVKAGLLKLAAAIVQQQAEAAGTVPVDEGLNRLGRAVEGSLARVVMDQLAALPGPDQAGVVWQISLPVREGFCQEAIELLLRREPRPGQVDAEPEWSVELELNPPGFGRFCAKLSWQQGRLQTWLWSDTIATTACIAAHTGLLEARYRQAGLEPGLLSTLTTPRPGSPARPPPSPAEPLLDIRL